MLLTEEQAKEKYRKDLRFAMTIACIVFALPIWAFLREWNLFGALCGWAAAEAHFWLCSTEPTEQWRKENGLAGAPDQ